MQQSAPVVRNTKHTRKTWIVGIYANDTKEIWFPPVTPWIKNDVQAMVVKTFMEAMGGVDPEVQRKIDLHQRTIAELSRRTFLTPVDKRKLATGKRKLAKLEQSLGGEQEAELRRRALGEELKLHLMRGITDVQVATDGHTSRVVLTTSPILIHTTVLGTYDFSLDPSGRTPADAFKLRRRDNITGQGPHPHWTDYGCFGTFGPVFQQMLLKKDFGSLIGTFLRYLSMYDSGSPLVRLTDFKNHRRYINVNPTA